MLQHLKNVLKYFVALQLKINSRERTQGEAGTDLFDVFADLGSLNTTPASDGTVSAAVSPRSPKSQDEEEKAKLAALERKKKRAKQRAARIEEARTEARGRLIRFGPATNKIRQIIADKIMNTKLSDLERTKPLTVSSLMVLNLRGFQEILRKVFPEAAASSIGAKYKHMPQQFKNEFLHSVS